MTNIIDWKSIVRDLLEGRTQLELQEITGVHQGVISDLKSGKPKPHLTYVNGAALIKAHQDLCQDEQPEEA
jgi:predicted transcriptional regulator